MLTSSNQYLRPEYLTPLPTTLDAKKSPLALLAQTCSQIGADAPNAKLIQSSEKASKSSKSDVHKDKNEQSHKSALKNDGNSLREKSKSPEERSNRVRTPVASKSIPNGRCSSNLSSPRASPNERKTPAAESSSERISTPDKCGERRSPQTPSSSASKTAFTPNILTSSSDPAIKDLPLGTFKPGVPHTSSPYLAGYPTPSFTLGMDLMTSTLMNQHHALKGSGLVPYIGYSRLKAQDTISSVCRDPYCTGCSVSSHLLGASSALKTCPAGCSQCDHPKPPTSVGYLSHSPAAAAYAHAQLAALAAASHLPYVCNWISGDAAYCGKRFSSSEELLGHLRTHTSGAISDTGSALSMLGSPGLPPTHPLLHRTYPTPPLSPLATARYHPYSKPSLLPPSFSSASLAGFQLGHPGLSPYLSPYSIYGPRPQ